MTDLVKKEELKEDASSFSYQMRVATRQPHAISDALANTKLALALSNESVWMDAMIIFYEIFKRLEDYTCELDMPELNALFVCEGLYRTRAFETDLENYYGRNWKKYVITRSEVAEYLDHLEELKNNRPILLVAYVYHLYMGLLSGGQIIRSKRKITKVTSSVFTYLFLSHRAMEEVDWVIEFPGLNIGKLKKEIKRAVNNVAEDLSEEDRADIIEESKNVFMYNNSVIKTVKGANRVIIVKFLSLFIFTKVCVLLCYFYNKYYKKVSM